VKFIKCLLWFFFFFFIVRPYRLIPTVIFDKVVLFNGGIENGRYFALLFVEQNERVGNFF
jgi:hypothetical protein